MSLPCFKLGPEHAEALATLEASCFDSPWSVQAFTAAFTQPIFSAFGIFSETKSLAGYITVYQTEEELEVLNVAVRTELRQQRLGHELLGTALQTAKKTGILRAVLEVRVTNAPAIRLYESFGFQRVGLRRGYYHDTGEDALVYTLVF